jgi:hypothetical protein
LQFGSNSALFHVHQQLAASLRSSRNTILPQDDAAKNIFDTHNISKESLQIANHQRGASLKPEQVRRKMKDIKEEEAVPLA